MKIDETDFITTCFPPSNIIYRSALYNWFRYLDFKLVTLYFYSAKSIIAINILGAAIR